MRFALSGAWRFLRFRQDVILLVGAIAIVLAIGASATGFYRTPLALGLAYLAGAVSGGAQGSYRATAVEPRFGSVLTAARTRAAVKAR